MCKFRCNFARTKPKRIIMIASMTGYGKAEHKLMGRTLLVEIKSLNSKQLDLNLRIASELRDRETLIRQRVAQQVERGKVEMRIELIDSHQSSSPATRIEINEEAFARHHQEIISLCQKNGISLPDNHWVDTLMRFKDVTREVEALPLSDEAWKVAENVVEEAVQAFQQFRRQEGKALQQMFNEKLDAITLRLEQVEPYEKNRVENIRQHLLQNLDKLAEKTRKAIDKNRLEEEMIYYLEKLDITEEKVRLKNHIRYFRETMESNEQGVGKKLGFIAQEMGREINTLGSKSNQSEMQILVVQMKDLLEQIKEQVLNVL